MSYSEPRTIEKYLEYIEKEQIEYGEIFDIFPFELYQERKLFDIKTLSLWILDLLISISYNNFEKIKFVNHFLLKYLSNEEFKNIHQGYRILFIDYQYSGYLSYSDLVKFKNPDHKNISTYVISETSIYDEYIDIEVNKTRSNFTNGDDYINSYQINNDCSLNINIDKNIIKIFNKNCVIDSGCTITHLICNQSWDHKNKKFIETNDHFRYLNTIKDKTETMEFKGISCKIVKQVVCFLIPVYIGIDDLFIPLTKFSISIYDKKDENNNVYLIGMDAISQCNYISFIEDKKYKIHLSICDKEDKNYYVMTLSSGIFLVKDDIYSDNIYYHVSELDIDNFTSIRKFKTLKNLSLIVIDCLDIDFKLLYQSELINSKDEYVCKLLETYDGVYFKTDDKNLMILKNNFPLSRIDIQSTQNNIKSFQIGAGYIIL